VPFTFTTLKDFRKSFRCLPEAWNGYSDENDHPVTIGIHCLAHRLELAFKDVIKGEKSFEQLTTLLLGIYYKNHHVVVTHQLSKTFSLR
jgi:hypothetical protein